MNTKKIWIALFSVLFSFQMYAQETSEIFNKGVMNFYNNVQFFYSDDDNIINGLAYSSPNKKIKGTPYLKNGKWNITILFINNNMYSEIQLKYDLVIDELIIKSKFGNNVEKLININKLQVDSFIIDSSLFINSRVFLPAVKKTTYYKQIYKGKLSLYRSYNKRFIDMYDDRFPAGKFSILSSNLYFFENNMLINISNINSFLHYFNKEYRKKIKIYLKNNNIEFRDASQSQLENIMEYCNSLIY